MGPTPTDLVAMILFDAMVQADGLLLILDSLRTYLLLISFVSDVCVGVAVLFSW